MVASSQRTRVLLSLIGLSCSKVCGQSSLSLSPPPPPPLYTLSRCCSHVLGDTRDRAFGANFSTRWSRVHSQCWRHDAHAFERVPPCWLERGEREANVVKFGVLGLSRVTNVFLRICTNPRITLGGISRPPTRLPSHFRPLWGFFVAGGQILPVSVKVWRKTQVWMS